MTHATPKRITLACFVYLALATVCGELIVYDIGREWYGSSLAVVAAVISATPLLVALLSFAVQATPGGRAIVPVPGTASGDMWLLLLVLCQFVPVVELKEFVPAGWWGNTSAQCFVGMGLLLLAVVSRVLQLRAGAQRGAVLPSRTVEA